MLRLNQLSVTPFKICTIIILSSILIACGGSGGGGSNTNTPESIGPAIPNTFSSLSYKGASSPRDETVNRYLQAIWPEVALEARCGGCHTPGDISPAFANRDDINAAYDAAESLINTSNPPQSRLVTKVAEGHNCWLTNAGTCAALMTDWVTAFANVATGTSFLNALNLQEPTPLKTVGVSKQFPELASATNFETTIYPLTEAYCASCHSEAADLRQQPFIGSADIQVAYEAARSKINLEDDDASLAAAVSRLTVRLRDESHNCWASNCATSSQDMHDAIQDFANVLTASEVNPALQISRELNIDADGQAAAGGGRVENNVIAKWDFRDSTIDSTTRTADDISGVEPAITLNLIGNVEWLVAGGVRINDGKLQASTTTSAKLYDRITGTGGEYSIEAWVVPLNVTQDGPARIVSYSGGNDRRNFTMGQTLYDYNFQARASTTDADGQPAVSTPMADEVLQATLQHVVMTYSAVEGRKIYVNGELIVDNDPEGSGNLESWDRNFALVLGDEVSNDNQWQGAIRLLAIHNVAMLEDDIKTNFDIGVGQTFYLLFSVSHLLDAPPFEVPRSYIVLAIEQFDDFGYLFNEPFFVTFDSTATIPDIPVQGMRIGVNGNEAEVGQVYGNIDTAITQALVDAGEGRQVISSLGTIIAVDQGRDTDNFFLSFDLFGDKETVRVEQTFTAPVPQASGDEQSAISIKTFDEINEALSSLTGISKTNSIVATTFSNIRQQLPVNADIQGFVAAQQLAISQLAVGYCSALTAQEVTSTNYYGSFNFSDDVATAFGLDSSSPAAGRNQIIIPLLTNLLADNLDDQPDIGTLADDATQAGLLNNLMGDLIASCDTDNSCSQSNSRVLSMVTATCSAAFGSAMMLLQ
jgi:hypothetical protein